MNREGATLAVRCVGRGVVEGLAVVQRHATRWQVDGYGFGIVDVVAQIQQSVGRFGPFMIHGLEMSPRNELHRTVVDVHIIQGDPGAD